MEDFENLAAICAELLAFNQILFDADHPEAAYHALAAALHCCDDNGDVSTMRQVASIATEEHRRLAQHVRPISPWEIAHVAETTRWASLERIYAAIERQASAKVATLETRRSRRAGTRNA